MKVKGFEIGIMIAALLIATSTMAAASAGPPPIPSDYSGYVAVNGEPAPDGALVFAKIEDYTSSTQTSDGGYRLIIMPFDSTYIDKTIEFYYDPDAGGPMPAVMADETDTFEQGTSHDPFNLTVVIVDETPPVIVNISPSELTTSGATITWITDEPSTSQAEYGVTISYGSLTTLDPTLETSHSVGLAGLEEGTTYHFRVMSTDEAENTAYSGDHTFTTTTTSPPPLPPPPMPPSPTNEAPVADAGPDKTVYVDVAIHLNGAGSHDPDGTIEEYHWFPGDGSYKPGVKVMHVYGEAGVYTASLTITDNNGATSTDNCTITVLSMPAPLTALIFEAIPANSTGYVVDASSWADITVEVNTTDSVTVTVIKYETNPHPGDPIPGEGVPKYADVFVSDPDAVDWPIYVEMAYTDEEVEGLEESSLGMYYWDEAWQRCSDTGVDTERNVVWAYMTAEEAAGSPILIAGMHAIITPPLPPILSNLIITPDELELGDEVTINFDIENYGSQSQTYGVAIHIENVNDPPPTWPPYDVTMTTWVDLEAYEFKTVFFTITMDDVGDFNVTVAGMTASFKVGTWPPEPPLKPAEFEVTDMVITPEEVEPGDEVTISVLVTNIGEETGDYTITLDLPAGPFLRIQETVSLEGGGSKRVEFEVSRDNEGIYAVTVDELTGSFTVEAPPKPAEFEFSNLRIFIPGVIPPEVEREQTVTVTVSIEVENMGELEGDHTVELKVDGELIDSKGVTLEGGASTTVLFELTRGEGTHEVEVEGFTDSFTVNPKPTFWDKIPGFPYESITLGLVAVIIILWHARARSL